MRSALDWRHPRYHSVLRLREGGRTILVLFATLATVAAILFVIGRIDRARRSGTAVATIVSALFQPGGGLEMAPQGTQIRYVYVVNGTTYSGVDFRTWSDVSLHNPKVCFEPADPTNHLLVDGRIRCGIDAGP